MGRASAEMFILKPNTATSHNVAVVPRFAPTTTATAWEKVTRPALTNPMTVRVAALEDCTTAVNTAPESIPLHLPETRVSSVCLSAFPAQPFNPSTR